MLKMEIKEKHFNCITSAVVVATFTKNIRGVLLLAAFLDLSMTRDRRPGTSLSAFTFATGTTG